MIRKSAGLQYALLALVAALSLLQAGLGIYTQFEHEFRGAEMAATPFFNGLFGRAIPISDVQADRAGVPHGFILMTVTAVDSRIKNAVLHTGDAVYTVAGKPYTGNEILMAHLQQMHPNEPLPLTIWHGGTPLDTPPVSITLPVHAQRTEENSPTWVWVILPVFMILPVFCLFTGFYVVVARPRSPHAWLILGILGYFTALFLHPTPHVPVLYILTHIVNTLGQTAMPICFMLFGIYFPERGRLDMRVPWLKWVLLAPTLLLLGVDFLYSFGFGYNFHDIAPVFRFFYPINGIENIVAALQIAYAFFCLGAKRDDPQASPDARRRLRVLVAGSTAGLLPFFILLLIALVRHTDVGENIPEWLALSIFAILFIFPLTLAYVVVVQRAMDVRILVRQGTKYFFARTSVFIVSIVLATWMSWEITRAIANHGHRRTVDVVRMLAIILLFAMYRRFGSVRLQRWIDEKFFREAYSTEQLLAEISDEARNFVETTPLLETISRRLGETLHIDRIAVFLRSGDMFQLQFATGLPLAPGFLPSLPASSTTITTLTRGKTSPANVYRDDPSSWLVDATDAERTALADLSTELLVPLPGRNRLVGVIALGPKSSEEPYSKSDRQLLQSVASQTGLALENAELLESLTAELAQKASLNREIEIAREVQERLFPQTYPHVEGIGLAGYCRPAQFVGGDYYDFFLIPRPDYLPDNGVASHLAIAIGDISGKGISAALLMASLRASLRSVTTIQDDGRRSHSSPLMQTTSYKVKGGHGWAERNIAPLIAHVNRLVFEASTSNRYATFFYAELNPASRVLSYVNAGHNCPVILRGTGSSAQIIQLQPTGTVIGLLQDATYEQASIQLHPGDTLLAFTDGISEAMTAEDEEWGEDRMIAAAQALLSEPNCTYSAMQLLHCILTQADAFTAGAPQHDDMTLLLCTLA
jgi:sigma-B regulation protein RsbU (phosphoserine phosphatase)